MNKNTLLAFFLIALIMVLTPWYLKTVSPVPQEPAGDTTLVYRPVPSPTVTPLQIELSTSPQDVRIQENSVHEKIIHVENGKYSLDISNLNGGSFKSFILGDYDKYDSTLVNLIYEKNQNNLLLKFVSVEGDLVELDEFWTLDTPVQNIDAGRTSKTIIFSTVFKGKTITKSLTFHPQSYSIDLELNLDQVRNSVSQARYSLSWDGGLPTTEKNHKDEYNYFKGSANLGGGLLKPKRLKNGQPVTAEQSGQTNWVSVQNKYFISAIIPTQPAQGAAINGRLEGDHPVYNVNITQNINTENKYRLYLGPLDFKLVSDLGVDLEKAIDFGWSPLRPVGKLIIWSLKILHKAIPNYGVVLIIFSVLLKILLNPLTKKSFQSNRRMQDLQPKIAILKEKYKNDAQKMNKAQMALFKEEGVNPMGGCLPMLLQMPILISLFAVFRTTIEFRGAPFIWWISDLSAPDVVFNLPFSIPIYGSHVAILPIIMGVTMFLQQKLMSPAGGQQKITGYFMTGFFLLLFNSFPSGLNLYYTVFNALTIIQQKYLTPAPRAKKPPLAAGKKQKHKK
ncbi:MAG: membrane protein insertase YidC [Candidatus Neomarinimicrobiota bacterium]